MLEPCVAYDEAVRECVEPLRVGVRVGGGVERRAGSERRGGRHLAREPLEAVEQPERIFL